MENNNKSVAVAIVIVGLLIAGAIYYKPATVPTNSGNNQPSQEEATKQAKALLAKITPVSAGEHIQSVAKPVVTIVEYSDLECPYCKAFQWTMNAINAKYGSAGTDQMTWAFRQFPLNIHSKATPEAEAAECAAKLGGNEKFWQYIDEVYKVTPSNNGLDLALLPKIAKDLGLDATKFEACIKNHEAKPALDAQIKDATTIGVDGTPFAVVINDKGEKMLPFFEPVPATWSAEAKKIIEEMLTTYEADINKLRSGQ